MTKTLTLDPKTGATILISEKPAITLDQERQARYLAASGYLANLAETDSMLGDCTFMTMEAAMKAAADYADAEWGAYMVYVEVQA